MNKDLNLNFNPVLEILIATFVWGFNGVFIKFLNLTPTLTSFFGFSVPIIFIFLYISIKGIKIKTKNTKIIILNSFFNSIRMFLFVYGFLLTSIGNGILVWYTSPIFIGIISFFMLKEKHSKKNIFLFLISFLGLIFLMLNKEFSFQNNDFLGCFLIFLGAIINALVSVVFKKEVNKYTKTELIFYQNLIGAILFLPFLFIDFSLLSFEKISIGILYGFVIGILGFIFYFSALKKLKVSIASNLCYFEVIFAVLFGIIFFGEILTWNMIIGGSLIIGSSILLDKK
jgi:drug/metabolite transporter (DMT)-like permease